MNHAHGSVPGQPPQATPSPATPFRAAPYPGPPPRTAPHPAAARPVPTPPCRFCGSVPAASVTYRAHRGMILLMQFRRIEGPFCRDCGLEAFRRMTADTMLQGWWGIASFFITPIVLLINLCQRHRVAGLPAPGPSPYGPSVRSSGPGRPLLMRPQAIAGLLLISALVLIVALP